METLNDIIQNTLLRAQADIRTQMSVRNINASGRTSAAIQVRVSDSGYTLGIFQDGIAPLHTLEIGRKPGKVPYNFAQIIEEWAQAKGLDVNPWAVVMTIKKHGTVRYRNPEKAEDIYSTITKEAKKELEKEISKALRLHIVESIRSNW